MMLQRDAFIKKIHQNLSFDKDIYFLSADFGAESLDKFREDYPENFIHCGISEQAMVDVATGLALKNKKVFCYAMAPFLSLRALEQIKCGPSMMSLNITFLSIGIGLGYADAGPTHYITEDFACLRSIIGSTIYTCADSLTAENLATYLLASPHFSYVRMDRSALPNLRVESNLDGLSYRVMGQPLPGKIMLVGHGFTSHLIREVVDSDPLNYFGIDLINSKPMPSEIAKLMSEARGIVVADEQTPCGSLGSALMEECSKFNINTKVRGVTLPEIYVFENGGRNYLLNKLGLNVQKIIESSKGF